MHTSVREALQAAGLPAHSLGDAAASQGRSFPLSVRSFVGAPPAGAVRRKSIPLELLQRKFDEFINRRPRPPFRVRLDGSKFGQSTATVTLDDTVHGYDHEPFLQVELAKPGEVLEFPGIVFGTHKYHFRDLNSDGLSLELVGSDPVQVELSLHFETGGTTEINADDFPNIDLEHFNLKVKLELGLDAANHLLGLSTREEWVQPGVSVDASGLPDGTVAGKIESTMKEKVFDALNENLASVGSLVTRWLVGGDFHVLSAASDGQSLVVDYIVPPGQLEPFPEDPQAPLDVGALAGIEHIVVLMMENRSFDHLLGHLSKEGDSTGTRRTDVDGLRGGEKNRYKGLDHPSFPLPDTRFDESPCHRHACVSNQVNGGAMDGFVANFAASYEADGVEPGRVMGYHTAAHVPVYDALAREFLVCQRWFAAHPGPTFPNRFYTLTGRLNRNPYGEWEFDNPAGSAMAPVATRTLFDHLDEHGVGWRYYEHGYCFLRMFARWTTDTVNIRDAGTDAANFVADARSGNLPAVTFIDPDFIDVPPGNDDGAPADVMRGQHLVGTLVNALMEGPLWKKTLFVVTYDEHGGFYDHVSPPAAVPVSAIDRSGVRVPAFVVSPWVDKGTVSDMVFDHTSIAKTIARRFMSAYPPDMGARVAAANDLSAVLRAAPRDEAVHVPIPADPTPDAHLLALAAREAQSDDFKQLMQSMRERYPLQR